MFWFWDSSHFGIGNKQTHAQYSSHSTLPPLPIGAICNMCNCIVASPPICQSVRAALLKRCSMRTERSKRIKKPREKHIIMRGAITTYERLLLDDEWGERWWWVGNCSIHEGGMTFGIFWLKSHRHNFGNTTIFWLMRPAGSSFQSGGIVFNCNVQFRKEHLGGSKDEYGWLMNEHFKIKFRKI